MPSSKSVSPVYGTVTFPPPVTFGTSSSRQISSPKALYITIEYFTSLESSFQIKVGISVIFSGSVAPGDTIAVSVEVTNTGDRAGDEVVQLYVKDVEASVPRPLKELVGFQRINLQPGQKKKVTFKVAVNQLGFYNHAIDFVIEAGTVQVMVGNSSDDIRLTGEFEIVGNPTVITAKTFFSSVDVS